MKISRGFILKEFILPGVHHTTEKHCHGQTKAPCIHEKNSTRLGSAGESLCERQRVRAREILGSVAVKPKLGSNSHSDCLAFQVILSRAAVSSERELHSFPLI